MQRPLLARIRRARGALTLAGVFSLGLMTAVASLPAFAQASSANAVEARGFLDAGKSAFKAKDYPRAAGLFQQAFAKDSSLTIALYNQGFALKKANLLAQARDVYDAYTKVKPDDPDGFYGLADVYRLLGNETEAIQTFNLYLSKETRPNKDRYQKFAREYLAQAGAPSAKPEKPAGFQERQARKSADEMYVAASKDLRAGKFAAAAASFAMVYELDPRRHQALLKMGLALRKDKQFPAAASAYKRYMLAQPGDFDGMFGLAETKRQMNDAAGAAELFKKYLAREDRASRKKYRAYAQQQLAALKDVVAAQPAGVNKPVVVGSTVDPKKQALLEQGRKLYRAKDYAGAAKAYDQAWQLDKNDADPLRKKALSLRKGNAFREARVIYESLVGRDRDDLDSVFGLAETLRLEGNADRSKKVFTTYVAKERRPARKSYVDYARKQLAEGAQPPASTPSPATTTPAPAVVAETGAVAKPQPSAEAKAEAQKLLLAGKKAYGEKKYADAIAAFRAAQAADATLDDAWLKEALALRKSGALDEARKAYLQYQARRPDDLDAVFGIAETDRLAGKNTSALTLFRKYVADEKREDRKRYVKYAEDTIAALAKGEGEDVEQAKALVDKGNTFYRNKEYDAAADAFARAMKAMPSDTAIAHRQALALRKAKRLDEAIAAYDALIAVDDTDLDAVFGRAESLRLRGDNTRALEAFRSYVSREARPERQSYVGYANEKLAALEDASGPVVASTAPAEPVVGKSVRTPSPSPAAPSERHAAVLGRNLAAADLIKQAEAAKTKENYSEARQYLALAIARSPRDPDAYLLRGELYDAVGNADKARESYLKVLELAAGTPTGDRAEKRLNGADGHAGPQIVRSARKTRPATPAEEAKVNAAILEGRAALDSGTPNEAVSVLEEAVRTDKRRVEAWMVLGDAYLAAENADGAAKAVGAFQRAAYLAPNSAAPLWGLAVAYDKQAMKAKATPLFAQYAKSTASDVDSDKQQRAALIAQGLDTKRPWVRR